MSNCDIEFIPLFHFYYNFGCNDYIFDNFINIIFIKRKISSGILIIFYTCALFYYHFFSSLKWANQMRDDYNGCNTSSIPDIVYIYILTSNNG